MGRTITPEHIRAIRFFGPIAAIGLVILILVIYHADQTSKQKDAAAAATCKPFNLPAGARETGDWCYEPGGQVKFRDTNGNSVTLSTTSLSSTNDLLCTQATFTSAIPISEDIAQFDVQDPSDPSGLGLYRDPVTFAPPLDLALAANVPASRTLCFRNNAGSALPSGQYILSYPTASGRSLWVNQTS
jgi:hypothetical protein